MEEMRRDKSTKTKKSVEKYHDMINIFIFLLCRVLSGLHFAIRDGRLHLIALPKPRVLSIEEIHKNDSGNAITLVTKNAIDDENRLYNIPILIGSSGINDVSEITRVWNTMMLNQIENIIKHGITFLGMSFKEVSELDSKNVYLLSDKNTAEIIKNESEVIANAIKDMIDRDFESTKKQIELAIELNESFIVERLKREQMADNESYEIEMTIAGVPAGSSTFAGSNISVDESDSENENLEQKRKDALGRVWVHNNIAYAMSKILDVILLLDPNVEQDYKIMKSNIGDYSDEELGDFIQIYNKLFIVTVSFILASPIIYYFITKGTEQLSIEVTNEEVKKFLYESMYHYVFYYKLFQKHAYMNRKESPIFSEFGYFD